MQNKNTAYNITVLTLYPDAFPGYLGLGVAGRGLRNGLWSLNVINIRNFAKNKYKTVDDKIFGGGAGLLMKPDILDEAIRFALDNGASKNIVYPNPKGSIYNTAASTSLAKLDGLTFICGHFEGIDQRIIDKYSPMEISIGDYILSGGELSTIVILDSALRRLPNMLNSDQCIDDESLNNNLLECPHYTKPAIWQDIEVPDVLLSGNHQKIKEWRLQKSEFLTKKRRPDLWENYCKSKG